MVTVAEALARYPGAVTFIFGDGPEMNAEILALVRAGRKTVTCSAWDQFGEDGEPLPVAGRVDISLDWAGAPAIATRTLKVDKIRFCDVTEAMIPPMGEFEDLAGWRRGYEAFLRRAGNYAPEVPMMIETFEMVEDFA